MTADTVLDGCMGLGFGIFVVVGGILVHDFVVKIKSMKKDESTHE